LTQGAPSSYKIIYSKLFIRLKPVERRLKAGSDEQLRNRLQCRKMEEALRRRTDMANDFANGKQQLHQLIEQLPIEQVTAVLQYMRYLRADPVLLSLLNAPPDDEPYTEEQRERDAEAEASIAKGDGISQEELLRQFGH
jgi:hypothetical protein